MANRDAFAFAGPARPGDPGDVPLLSPAEKSRLLASLGDALRDVVEVVPSGEPVTRMRHADSLHAAPGVTLRETSSGLRGEAASETEVAR